MWQTDWAQLPRDGGLAPPPAAAHSALEHGEVQAASMLFWMEHCVECAVPECYTTCPLFVARADQKCARFHYGIYPNRGFRGLFDYGAEIHFRRWGKLESKLGFASASPAQLRRTAGWDALALTVLSPVSNALAGVNPKQRLKGGYNQLRERALRTGERTDEGRPPYDDFVIEVYNPGPDPVTLILECVQHDRIAFRESLQLPVGEIVHQRYPFARLGIDPGMKEGTIRLWPDQDAQPRLVFTWLDFVRYRTAPRQTAPADTPQPARLVKCVAWDLDNTLWQGILIEADPDKLELRPEVKALILALDERGIIQTIVSKNDHEPALEVVRRLGLEDYFISPAINWGPKSHNLKAIADELNINIDTFAVIDDSDFERREISTAWPQVRVFSETGLLALLERPEFAVPITAETKDRRLSYLAEGKRKEIAANFGADYDAFLRGCGMTATLFRPDAEQHIARCLELIQRSNQLNLSTRRYERAEFDALLADPAVLAVALAVADKFGDYGTVGFATIGTGGPEPELRDLVISCRVAKKKVEHAWFQWVADTLAQAGHQRLRAAYKPTDRNGILRDMLLDLGFTLQGHREDGRELYQLDLTRPIPGADIVKVVAESFPARNVAPVPAE